MKERPILFQGEMVRALLNGSKTQTRRVVKITHRTPGLAAALLPPAGLPARPRTATELSPYGQPGERLWVRESFLPAPLEAAPGPNQTRWNIAYAAGGQVELLAPSTYNPMLYGYERWSPSIHMPRWASRILLEVTDVRVERLQDISEADAIAEGIEPNWNGDLKIGPNGFGGEGWVPECGWRHYLNSMDGDPAYDPVESYRSLWEQINGSGSWEQNPWVWAISFRRLETKR